MPRRRDRVDAVECKWDPGEFDPAAMVAFREHDPKGKNYVVSSLAGPPCAKRIGGLEVSVSNPEGVAPV